jgi:apolipoprotein N-acyltransferase
LAYAKLRAIEQRKWVARSANTGISGFINPLGKMVQQSNWWEKTALKQEVQQFNKQTLYCRMGDISWLLILCGLCGGLGSLAFLRAKKTA